MKDSNFAVGIFDNCFPRIRHMSTFFFTSYQTYHIDLINVKSRLKEKIEKVREGQRMMLSKMYNSNEKN